jgi:hypothetical protein
MMMARQEQDDASQKRIAQPGGITLERLECLGPNSSQHFSGDGALENFDFDSFLYTGEADVENDSEEIPDKAGMMYRRCDGTQRQRHLPGLDIVSEQQDKSQSCTPPSAKLVPGEKRELNLASMRGYRQRMRGPSSHPGAPAAFFAPPPQPSPPSEPQAADTPAQPLEGEKLLHHLIALQSFEGSWTLTASLLSVLDVNK